MLYTTREASDKTGATIRQLQNWDETGIVMPRRVGRLHRTGDRRYTAAHLKKISAILQLFGNGVGRLARIQRVLRRLRHHHIEISKAAVVLAIVRREYGASVYPWRSKGRKHFH